MATLEDLQIPRITHMEWEEVLSHIKEVRFRRRTVPRQRVVKNTKGISKSPSSAQKLVTKMSNQEIAEFLKSKGMLWG